MSDFDGWKDIRIGRADEFADAGEILPPIVLNAEVRRHDGTTVTQRVSLYGTIRGVSPEAGAAINCVLHKTIKAKDFLPAFLNAIVLAAAGTKLPDKFRAIVIGTESKKPTEWTREFRADGPQFGDRVSDRRRRRPAINRQRLLPANRGGRESRQEIATTEKPRDLVDTVEQVLLNDPPTCSSDYGPVRNPRDFDPPDEEKIEQIVKRRFNPIIGIFK